MSDQHNKLRRQLERATAAECPPDGPLDAETASLREGWLALGQLLEAAQPAGDKPLPLAQPPRSSLLARRPLVGIAALAASLLIGLSLAGHFLGAGPSRGPAPIPGGLAVEEFQWDDSLDQQLASAGEEIVRIQQDWYRLTDAFGPVRHGLSQMEQDIEDSTL